MSDDLLLFGGTSRGAGRTPASFYAIGLWSKDFPQLTDAEGQDLLSQSREAQSQEQAAATSR